MAALGPAVESKMALYTTWDEEWRGRVPFAVEANPRPLADRTSQRLLDEYRTMKAGGPEAMARAARKATEDVIEAAEAAIEQGAFLEATQVLSDAITAGDDSSLLLLLRGQALLKQGEPEAALVDLDLCIKITEEPDAQLFFELGDCSAAIQENKTAANFFRKAIQAEPGYAVAHWRLADVLAALGDEEGAAKSYAKVCETDTQVHLRYLQIAEEDAKAGKYAEAIRTLDAVEKIQPGDFRVFWQRANCHMYNQPADFEQAYRDISRCIELDPLREDKVFMVRGRCSIENQDWTAAQADVTRFLEKAPDSIEGRLLRAKLSMRDVSSPFNDGTKARLHRATANLQACREHAGEHHASQQEEDDANAALAAAEQLFEELTAKQADELVKRSRAVMDYDHVVAMNSTQKLGCAKLKAVDAEADFAIAKVLCYEPGFERNHEQIKEACDSFWKAWCRGIQEPLQSCCELVVAEKLLDQSRKQQQAEQEEENNSQELEPVSSLRLMCAAKLVESGKYGGRKLPACFHRVLAQYYLRRSGGPEFARSARHLTMAWCNEMKQTGECEMQEMAGLCGYTLYMARRSVDSGGNPVVPKVKSLVNQCVGLISADEEAFPGSLELIDTLREQIAVDGGKKAGGKKK